MKKIDIASAALLIVGGLNWGLVAIANFDLVAAIFGLDSARPTRPPASSTAWSAWPLSTSSPSYGRCPRGGARAATRWRPDRHHGSASCPPGLAHRGAIRSGGQR